MLAADALSTPQRPPARTLITDLLRSPAAWCFAVVFVGSVLALIAAGETITYQLLYSAGTGVFLLISALITANPPRVEPDRRPRIYAQTAVLLLVIVLTAMGGLIFHGILTPEQGYVPLWSPLMQGVERLGFDLLNTPLITSPGNSMQNMVAYVVIPLIALILLGARPHELGFRRGHRVILVLLLWCTIPALAIAASVAAGDVTALRVAQQMMGAFLQAGFSEEVLFRGGLQTRLERLMRPSWAVVLQALIFGVWHLGLNLGLSNGDFGLAVARAVIAQGFFGLIMGVLFARTRNLIVPVAVHTTLNAFSAILN